MGLGFGLELGLGLGLGFGLGFACCFLAAVSFPRPWFFWPWSQ